MEETKTFSQEELNQIISDRLKSERAKMLKEVQAKEAELARRESLMAVSDDWRKRGLPVELLPMLDAEKLEDAASILENRKTAPAGKAGFGGGKAPDSGQDQLVDENGNPTDKAIRIRMGLDRKE